MLENRFTWFTIAGTFLLLLIGGTVNPTGSSLACPEPTLICHGQLFPEMTGGVLYEHGHRLVATSVGLLQIALTVLLWRRRPSLRRLGGVALVMVCVQGALGAITVHYKLPWIVSTAHLLLAMGYLATLLFIAWRTRSSDQAPTGGRAALGPAHTWIAVSAALVLLQILLGGLMRHHGGALASIDLPLHHGSVWPDGPLALKLHMAHRIGGVVVGLAALAMAAAVWRRAAGWGRMRAMAFAVPWIVGGQISLGLLTIATLRNVPIAVAHFGGAVLLWSVVWAMWLTARGVMPARAARSGAAQAQPPLGALQGARG